MPILNHSLHDGHLFVSHFGVNQTAGCEGREQKRNKSGSQAILLELFYLTFLLVSMGDHSRLVLSIIFKNSTSSLLLRPQSSGDLHRSCYYFILAS